MSDLKTLIYIASDARSGSTLLDNLLGNYEETVNVGELRVLHDYIVRQGIGSSTGWICRCGKVLRECSFWSAVLERYEQREHAQADLLITAFRDFKSPFFELVCAIIVSVLPSKIKKSMLLRLYRKDENKSISRNCFRILDYVSEVTRKHIIIDSSKVPNQLFGLLTEKDLHYDIKVIYLVRDGRATCYSKVNRSKQRGKRLSFSSAVFGWVLVNLKLLNLRCFLKEDNFLTVKYEDLCEDPVRVMRRISNKLNLPFRDELIELSAESKHNIAGSQREFTKGINIQLDERWKSEITPLQRVFFACTAGLLNKKWVTNCKMYRA